MYLVEILSKPKAHFLLAALQAKVHHLVLLHELVLDAAIKLYLILIELLLIQQDHLKHGAFP